MEKPFAKSVGNPKGRHLKRLNPSEVYNMMMLRKQSFHEYSKAHLALLDIVLDGHVKESSPHSLSHSAFTLGMLTLTVFLESYSWIQSPSLLYTKPYLRHFVR